jgi:hypothetical protein
MKLPRRRFLQPATGAIALPAVSPMASAQAYSTRRLPPFELPQIMIRPKIKELPRQGFVRFVAGLRRFLVRDATN